MKSLLELYDLVVVDIMGGLDKIVSRVFGDEKYVSEYDFVMVIYEFIGVFYDGYFRFVFDVFRGFFCEYFSVGFCYD